jgi:hypothetical protein
MEGFMQPITFLGLALCLFVLYKRARKAKEQPPSTNRQRLKTAHLLWGAVLAWLVISLHLQHLNRALSGEPKAPQSTWERVIFALSDWGI